MFHLDSFWWFQGNPKYNINRFVLQEWGNFTWSNGDKYVGEFKDGEKHGQGTYIFSDEKKYVGEWKNGKQNGQGTLTFPDGRNGVGEWRENKPWNITEYNKNGNILGKWGNGKLKVK